MLITTTDPMIFDDVQDIESAPHVIEDDGEQVIKIYFESVFDRSENLGRLVHGSEDVWSQGACDAMVDHPRSGSIN